MTIDEKYENLSFSFRALAKSAGKLAKENEDLKREIWELRKILWRLLQSECDLKEKLKYCEYARKDMVNLIEWWDKNERKK